VAEAMSKLPAVSAHLRFINHGFPRLKLAVLGFGAGALAGWIALHVSPSAFVGVQVGVLVMLFGALEWSRRERKLTKAAHDELWQLFELMSKQGDNIAARVAQQLKQDAPPVKYPPSTLN
jgi:hypothetical protein